MSYKAEQVRQKSPAEFFAENQIIAGFDNPGKSLYTSIRELVENSLDAAESINELPTVELEISEMTEATFNNMRGVDGSKRNDKALFADKGKKGKGKGKAKAKKGDDDAMDIDEGDEAAQDGGGGGGVKGGRGSKGAMYYRVKCKDNGVGMQHKAIPDMFGRVLSGSKYGVRQTRGKFGLGAKMALIWSKKSTGMPVEILSAHSTSPQTPPTKTSHCILDIDIHKNEPQIEKHDQRANPEGWRGSEITVTVLGNWTTYKSRVTAYLQQLAVITPYADFKLTFKGADSDNKRDFVVHYRRRSDQMPPLPTEVKYHPSSVDNLVIRQLLQQSNAKNLQTFLQKELQGVTLDVSKRVVEELGTWAKKENDDSEGEEEDESVLDKLARTSNHVSKLTQVLRDVQLFKAPDGTCLSPAGEYNLRLGIMKELDPDYVATWTMPKASSHEGHAFIVEAGVAIGGNIGKEGITVYRFANRIPMLFEGGSDVVTRVANKSIKWSSYKIDHKKQRVGVFVSTVSTRIPFKGTSKEYIGEDVTPINDAVKKALQMCCHQLKAHLSRRDAENDARTRRKNLVKYIPDVTRSIFSVLNFMYARDMPRLKAMQKSGTAFQDEDEDDPFGMGSSSSSSSSGKKRRRGADDESEKAAVFDEELKRSSARRRMLGMMDSGNDFTEDNMSTKLTEAADATDQQSVLETNAKQGIAKTQGTDVFIVPLREDPSSPDDVKSAVGGVAKKSVESVKSVFAPMELEHPCFSMKLFSSAIIMPKTMRK